MAEPKDKDSKEWRDWKLRHSGISADDIRIANKRQPGIIKILREFLDDLEEGERNEIADSH